MYWQPCIQRTVFLLVMSCAASVYVAGVPKDRFIWRPICLCVFEFAGPDGHSVLLEDVIQRTIDHGRLPDFSFWSDRVNKGTLCAVTVSAVAQGRAAGEIARGILLNHRRPSDYPMEATKTGPPMINLARARKLGLTPSSSVLLTAKVVTEIH